MESFRVLLWGVFIPLHIYTFSPFHLFMKGVVMKCDFYCATTILFEKVIKVSIEDVVYIYVMEGVVFRVVFGLWSCQT